MTRMQLRNAAAALVLAAVLPAAMAAESGGWQKKYPVVKYGVIPVETQTGTTKTMDTFLRHAEKTTGTKWELYQATDYSGVMNALIAGQIHLAWLSGFSYCQTYSDSKGNVEPLVAAAAIDGSMGYNAVVVVKADSPYKTIDDLKGKTVARTDPLSGSGYLIPTAAFRAMGKPVDEYYKSPLSGGHVQSVLGVLKGTYDAAFTWTSKGDGFGNLRQMMNQGLLKREDIRIIWTSDPLPSPPVVIRKDVPADMRADMLKLFTGLKDVDMRLAEAVAQGKTTGIMAVSHKDYTLMCQAAADEREAPQEKSEVTEPTASVAKPRGAAARFETEYAAYRRKKRIYAFLSGAAFVLCVVAAGITAKFDVVTLAKGLPRTTEFLVKLIPPIGLSTFAADMREWYWDFGGWLNSLLNTLLMAYLATVLGTTIGGFLSFFAARNLARHYAIYWVMRRVLEIARTVPDIVWALLFIIAFGIGPLAGVLAITVHTIGAQGKLFAEVNENISTLPIDGIRAAGGTWWEEIRFAVLPQVIPNYLSYTFWRLELNVRSATIVGFVGAGGIGHDLFTSVQLLYFSDAGAILLIIVATIMLIDMLSEKFRHSAIGKASFAH